MNITQVNRNKLFYSKFCYRVTLKYLGVRFVSNTKDLTHFKQKIDMARKYNSSAWYRIPVPELTDINLDLCEKLISFFSKYDTNKEVTFLHNNQFSVSVYTSNIDILKELYQIDNDIEITQALPPPAAIMHFAKEPSFKYRIYLKSVRATESLITELRDFGNRYRNSDDIKLSDALHDYILYNDNHRKVRYRSFLSNGFFINYNDPNMVTLMHLLFSECMGKNYKLEKRPG